MKRKFMAIMLVMLLVISMAVPASAALNNEVKESVVFISYGLECEYGSEEWGSGSGFFVGYQGEDPMYLVTNYHVIRTFIEKFYAGEPFDGTYNGYPTVIRGKLWVSFDDEDRVEAYPVVYNAQKDVAILKLADPTDKRIPTTLCKPTADMSGIEVYAIGYPGLSENFYAEPVEERGLKDQSITGGKFSRLLTTEGTGQVNIQIDCEIYPGNSGGPLVNEEGQVLGICTWSVTTVDGKSMHYAVSIEEAIYLLHSNNIPYTLVDPDEPEPTEPEPTPAPTEPEPTSEPTPVPTEPPVPGPNTVMIIGIACAAVAVLLIIVLVVVNNNKKKKQEEENRRRLSEMNKQPAAPAPVVQKAYVRSLAANHGGMRVALQPGKAILIGRSKADCAISFADNAPGVSGRHCSVMWDGQSFIITDMNSSYGTYLQNGQKLVAGKSTTLQPGTSFWLGDKQNILRVELE